MDKLKKKIPEKLYEQILENMPFLCVDVIILHNKKVLLVRRKEEPEKDSWWLVGGRVYKNESVENAVRRIVIKETGLNVELIKEVGFYDYRFKKSRFPNLKTGIHTPTLIFVVKSIDKEVDINLDETSLDYKWINKIDNDLHHYVKRGLKDSGVFK